MIRENVEKLLEEVPKDVILVAAAKGRTPDEIKQARDAGIKVIGENYLQEAEAAYSQIKNTVKWHFIGHLQRKKVKKAVQLFDMIETLDSIDLAQQLNESARQESKIMPVLVEINSAKEGQKFGVFPEDAERFIKEVSSLPFVKIMGLMTMGPLLDDPQDLRPYFKKTKQLFDSFQEVELANVQMRYLSMGMSASYQVALEEGANIIRIGTLIFGQR